MSESIGTLINQLEEKVIASLQASTVGSNAYETLQYVQSFVARKKKTLGPAGTSRAVFHSVKLIITHGQNDKTSEAGLAVTAGALLKWFIEDGAGKDFSFHLHTEQTNADQYCDIQHLLQLIEPLDIKLSGPIVNSIYNPLHVLLAKAKVKRNSPLQKRLNKLEILFAQVLHDSKQWLGAFKSYVRLNDAAKVAEVLENWSNDGYTSEKPLFFARGLLQVLADNKAVFANDLLHASQVYVVDNALPQGGATAFRGGGSLSAGLAVWHLTTILTDLVNFQPMPRVDKTKLFGLLHQRYSPLLNQLDSKLLDLFLKAGELYCNFQLEGDSSPNPMAMLQNLLNGGGARQQSRQQQAGAPAGPMGGMDLNAMMQMMARMQSLSK
jgi:hypothetical protein